jgi:GT2 family glycosyltransferase
MPAPCDLTIVLGTFNRADQLDAALCHLLAQGDGGPSYELVVVDNNSADRTREIVEAHLAEADGRLRYLFEPRQGLSYARNAGIAAARGDIVAFTDDDVRVSADWTASIARAFRAHPDVDCVGGRILPVWPAHPPPWLTRRHWIGPLALQDYGEHAFVVDARRPRSLAGASLAFRKRVFDRIGVFSPDFPRSEDTELLLRLWRGGGRSLYVPDMITHAAVQTERLTKDYHRRWHSNIGGCNARMSLEELSDPVLGLRDACPTIPRVFGAPRFAFRQLASEVVRWGIASLAGHEDAAFSHETRVRLLGAYIRESRALSRCRAEVAEVAEFKFTTEERG